MVFICTRNDIFKAHENFIKIKLVSTGNTEYTASSTL